MTDYKELVARLLEEYEDGSLVVITEAEQRKAAEAIERLSAEKYVLKACNKTTYDSLCAAVKEIDALKSENKRLSAELSATKEALTEATLNASAAYQNGCDDALKSISIKQEEDKDI